MCGERDILSAPPHCSNILPSHHHTRNSLSYVILDLFFRQISQGPLKLHKKNFTNFCTNRICNKSSMHTSDPSTWTCYVQIATKIAVLNDELEQATKWCVTHCASSFILKNVIKCEAKYGNGNK